VGLSVIGHDEILMESAQLLRKKDSFVQVSGASLLVGGLPIGNAAQIRAHAWERLCKGKMLPSTQPERDQLSEITSLNVADSSVLGTQQLMALAVTEIAWQEAGLHSSRLRIRGAEAGFRHTRYGCVSGSSLGGITAFELEITEGKRTSPYSLSRWRGNSVGAAVTKRFGLGGGDYSLNSASATGAQCLYLAATLIQAGLCDLMVVVAADAQATPQLSNAMHRNGSLTRDAAQGPLTSGRSGMNPVPGAACLILESAEHLSARGGRALANWLGGECANEAYHMLAPEPGGQVLRSLLKKVPIQPDWVSMHATGTASFDAIEVEAIRAVLNQKRPWLTSIKSLTGHALGASVLIEAAIVIEGLQRTSLPPWPADTDPLLDLASIKPSVAPQPETALLIGQGMGGNVVINMLGAAC
jgi:3-oxoacyl-(acyl-carrier-protein) synthase